VVDRLVPPNLVAGEFRLRPFRREDADAWYGYLCDPRVTEHTSWPPITREFIAALVEKVIDDYDDLASLRWALARQDDDRLVGSCGYLRLFSERHAAELAYDLAPAYWRRGIMSSAVSTVVDWAFRMGSLSRVEAFVMTTNEPSISLLERSGFTKERLFKGHRLARGVPRDFFLYSIESHAG